MLIKKTCAIILLLHLTCLSLVKSQSTTIKGVINDTINKQQLANTSISLLRATDSVLVTFTRSAASGSFQLKNITAGKYITMITMPSYANYFDKIEVDGKTELDLGTISMTLKSRLLEEVFVKQTIAAIRIKGDTVEFKADSFKVRAGASVEEMLRKLPGLQVDKDGNITAQGTKVEKVLVDGEEFFGDDPTMATKNLQADAIDKVQVFDKKSDQAAFSGIDDGTKIKTINLTMKDDKKKGYFGKIKLAAGPENRWNNNVMLNQFKTKKKLSVYGIMSSTGKTGLNWEERDKFGASSSMEYNADGGYFYSSGGGDEFDSYGSFYGEGIPTSWSAGTHYSNKYNGDKQTLNGSYRYNKLNTEGGGTTLTQSILPENQFFTLEQRESFTTKQRHSANGTFEWQIDSFTSVKVVTNGYVGDSRSSSTFDSETRNAENLPLNNSKRFTSSFANNGSFNSNALIRKRFKKPGRTISLTLDQQFKQNENEGSLFSVNRFFNETNGNLKYVDTVDQQKLNDVLNTGYFSRIAYTEPVAKNVFVELGAGIRVSNSEAKRLSYDKSFSGKYDVLNDTFSNHYNFNVITQSGGMTWRYNGKKLTVSGGGDLALTDLKQKDELNDTLIKYNFKNIFPRGNVAYKFNSNSRVSLTYNGNTRQPTIEQIQPIADNLNPLNIAIGNPSLQQEFRHSFNLNFNSYKVLQQRGFNVYSSYNFISNAISISETTNTTGNSIGQRVYQYVNLNGNYSGYGGGGYNMKFKKADLNMSIGFNLNINHNNSIINGKPNVTDNNSYALNLNLYKFKEKKFDISYYTDVRFNTSTSSINRSVVTEFFTQNHNLGINVTLPYKLEINSNIEARLSERTSTFDQNNNFYLWNAHIGRKLFKNDKGLIKIQAYDILDQNRGYSRTINSNIIRENTFQSLSRYFMLSFVLNFNKTPGAVQGK